MSQFFFPLVGKSGRVYGRWGSAAKGAMGGFPRNV